jgi:hypothetical protein
LKEVLDVIIWGGFIYLLFVFIRGMNDTQVQKHKDKLDAIEKKNTEIEEAKKAKEESI